MRAVTGHHGLLFSGGLLSTGPYYDEVMADAPLLYLRLSDASGSTALDYSGYGRNGTYVNSPTLNQTGLLDGESDTAAVFNGTDESVTVPYGAWMNSGQTFSAEGLLNWSGSANAALFCRAEQTTGTTRWVWELIEYATGSGPAGPGIILLNAGTALAYRPTSPQGALQSQRRHRCLTYDNGRAKMYDNGRLMLDVSGLGTLNQPADGGMRIAARTDTSGVPSDFMAGKVDETAFYGAALSAARVTAHAVAAGLTPVVDTMAAVSTAARGIYALRGLNGYTGALIDVRRSSDNASRTINVSAGELDTADLAAWGGSDSVFVSQWYDQSANAHHMAQAADANQPRIVNAGTLETFNGKPVVNFTSTSAWMLETTALIGTNDSVTILMATDTSGFGRGSDGFGAGWSISATAGGLSVTFTSIGLSSYSVPAGAQNTFNAKGFRVVNASGGSTAALGRDIDGSQISTGTSGGNSAFRTSTIGSGIGRNNTQGIAGKVGEVMVWRSVLDHGQMQAVTANWGARFGF